MYKHFYMYKCIKLLISVTQMYGAETKASKKMIARIVEAQNTMCHDELVPVVSSDADTGEVIASRMHVDVKPCCKSLKPDTSRAVRDPSNSWGNISYYFYILVVDSSFTLDILDIAFILQTFTWTEYFVVFHFYKTIWQL